MKYVTALILEAKSEDMHRTLQSVLILFFVFHTLHAPKLILNAFFVTTVAYRGLPVSKYLWSVLSRDWEAEKKMKTK